MHRWGFSSGRLLLASFVALFATEGRAQTGYAPQVEAAPSQQVAAPLDAGLAPGVPAVATAPQMPTRGVPGPDGRTVLPVKAPFVLNAQEQADLDALLAAWEKSSSEVKTFKCNFERLEYDSVFGPKDVHKTQCLGELKFAAPDKGMFRITEIRNYNAETGGYVLAKGVFGEHWVCDGKSIFEFDHAGKKLVERQLPPEMQGKAISEGPLPFVFGAKAEELKKRYHLKIILVNDDEVWLDVYPKLRGDAANYSRIQLILLRKGLIPAAIQIHDPSPGSTNRSVYTFDVKNGLMNKFWELFERDFAAPVTPSGYKYVKYTAEEMRGGSPTPGAAPDARQATLPPAGSQLPPQ